MVSEAHERRRLHGPAVHGDLRGEAVGSGHETPETVPGQGGRHRAGRSDLAVVLRLLGEAGPYRLHITGILFLSMLAAPLALLTPLPLAIAVDSGIGSEPLPGFVQTVVPGLADASPDLVLASCALLFLLSGLLTQLQSVITTVLQTCTGERLLLAFRSRIFQHLQLLSLSYHDRAGTADSVYRIQYDARALQYVAVTGLVSLVSAVVTIASMIYVTARIDTGLALVALCVIPPLVLVSRQLRSRVRQVERLESGALSVVQEVLTGLRVVKSFGQEDREQERFVGRSREGVRARLRLTLAEGAYGLLVGLIVAAGSAAVLLIGGPARAQRRGDHRRAARRDELPDPAVRPREDGGEAGRHPAEPARERRAGVRAARQDPRDPREAGRPAPRASGRRGDLRRGDVRL